MTIQANFPAIKPSLMLDFANTKQLDSRITYTRASTASYYDGVTTSMAEQNLLLQSQTFDTTWSVFNTSVTSNTDVAPDGTTTADTVTDSTAANIHILQQAMSGLLANTSYTVSCYLKKGTNNYAALTLTLNSGSGVWIAAVFDLNAGTVSQTANGASGTLSASSITSVGNGWYRCVITGTTTSAPNYVWISTVPAASGNTFGTTGSVSYTGTGTTIIAWGAQLEQRSAVSAYTATTTQAITNYIPKLQTAASGVARFDNNPTTGESLGLLIEESRTNLLTYSAQFDNAAWTTVNSCTITANTIVAPDGTLTGDKLVRDSAAAAFRISEAISVTSGTAYTFTCYAKASQLSWIILGSQTNFPTNTIAWFNLSSGVVGTIGGGITSTSITSVGNGWYRCSVTATANATGTTAFQVWLAPSDNNFNFTAGNTFDGLFIWGAQFEAGSFATSYIPTVASQVTRAADAASMTGTNFSSWYNNAEWTLYTETTFTNLVSSVVVSIDDNSFNNIARIGSYLNDLFTNVYSNSAFQFNQTPVNSLTRDVFYKIGFAAKPNSYAAIANTNTLITQNSGILFTGAPFQMTIGNFFNGDQFTGRIKKIAYYPVRVTNAQLAALTS